MKKTILLCGLLATLLQACSYKPLVDSSGRSGTFDISKAEGWSMESFDVVSCLETKQECPYIEKIYVVV